MKRNLVFALLFVCFLVVSVAQPKRLSLHPDNPPYFLWRGKPTILSTSGEHYGAVVKLDFDYVKYLDTLAQDKLNLTRTFLAYREPPGAFGIARNVLAPKQERFITPWTRSNVPRDPNAPTNLQIELPAGKYTAEWIDPITGAVARKESFPHNGGVRPFSAPNYKDDIALRIKAR